MRDCQARRPLAPSTDWERCWSDGRLRAQAGDDYARAWGRADRGRVLVGMLDQLGANACLLDRVLPAALARGAGGP